MGRVVAGMTISLDGYVADCNGSNAALYPDMAELKNQPPVQAAINATAAVVMGRRTFEMAPDPDWYAGNYEFQVPLFVVTRHAPAKRPKSTESLRIEFVGNGPSDALERARQAAAGKDVYVVGGPTLIQYYLAECLLDEMHIDVMPIALGGGLQLFKSSTRQEFKRLDVQTVASGRTTLRLAPSQLARKS